MRSLLRRRIDACEREDLFESFDFFDDAPMKLSLDAVEALAAIAEHGSFAAAAKALHKTQSAVSYSIKQLEESLDVEVFDRAGHRAVLTPSGRAILDEGRALLAQARRIEAIAARTHEAWEPRLEIVVDGVLPMAPLLRALQSLADDGVPTHVQVRVEFLAGVHERFHRDGADLMLVKDYARSDSLVEHALPVVECLLVAAAAHPIALEAAHAPLALADLQRHTELTIHDSSEERRDADARVFGARRVFYLSDFSTKRQALTMGLGYGWMPRAMIEDDLARGVLVELAYEGGARMAFTPLLVHPKSRPLGRAASRLLESLVRA
jgi:DNA-binding transcriptional LysR family regulator